MASSNSKFVVVSALLCNTVLAAAKFVAFAFTGSGAMLSEAVHVVGQSCIGVRRVGRKAVPRASPASAPRAIGV